MLLALLAALPALAAPAARPEPLWVELPTPADRDRARAAGLGWAEGRDGDWYLLHGDADDADAAGLRWRRPAMVAGSWSPTPADVAERLDALPSGTLVQIGESALGAPILAVRLGAGDRALRVLGGHHGDEGSSVEVALRVAEAVASDPALLPAGTELWVVPAVNPDGLDARSRTNARGVDLNRNYGWEWSTTEALGGEGAFSEPETRAVRALARARSFDAGLTLHSGAQNAGWVWNWTTEERPPEEPLLASLADAYAAACGAPDFWTTNGADWYVTFGDTTDWTYGAFGAYDLTLELTRDKSPPEEEVDTYVDWHLDAILAWLAEPADVSAKVLDATTGEPVPALVTAPGARAFQTGPGGAFARWLDAPADLVVTAPGYASATLTEETRLEPNGLATALPSPRLLSRGAGPTRVTLPGAVVSDLVLTQPGEQPVTVASAGPGAWTIDPAALAPGAWTLTTSTGTTPRALFVGEVDDRVALTTATLEGGILTLEGVNFAPGAEAWSIGGAARAMRPLTRLSESDGRLVFLLDPPDDDVLVWVNGAWLAAVDLQDEPTVDLTPPPAPEVEPRADAPVARVDGPFEVAGTCATGVVSYWMFAPVMMLIRRRR